MRKENRPECPAAKRRALITSEKGRLKIEMPSERMIPRYSNSSVIGARRQTLTKDEMSRALYELEKSLDKAARTEPRKTPTNKENIVSNRDGILQML